MGTSASSSGPGAGVPLDPPWLDDIELDDETLTGEQNTEKNFSEGNNPTEKQMFQPIAPKARFSNARRSMGEYIRSGSRDSLRRSLGHYSKKGMGGASALSQRMRVSAKVGANLYNTFRALRDDPNFKLGEILSGLRARGADATQVISAIVGQICPHGGSLDEVSSRNSATATLSEYLEKYPDVDIGNLSDDQMWELTGAYLGNEVFNRVQMDIGQSFEKAGIPFPDRINRLNEMREFIQVDVAVQLNKIRETKSQSANMQNLLQHAIQNTFETYEVEV